MNDYGLSVLPQYGLTAKTITRGRGILICDTEEGLHAISPCRGSEAKLQIQHDIQQHCRDTGFPYVDQVIKNQEEKMLSKDEEDNVYLVRKWFMGKECDTRSREEILECVETMAKLHQVLCMEKGETIHSTDLVEECARHNRELRKIRKYIQNKKKLSEFEEVMARSISQFLEQGEKVVEGMEMEGYGQLLQENNRQICHGECTQHNFLFIQEGVAVTNFEHWNWGLQIADLSQFMRKILEKHQWDIDFGHDMIASYQRIRKLSQAELKNLMLLLAYPWKYWKVANFYANSNKVWISPRNVEKLKKTISLWEPWSDFLAKSLTK